MRTVTHGLVLVTVAALLLSPAQAALNSDRELVSATRSNCLQAVKVITEAAAAHGPFDLGGDVAQISFTVAGKFYFAGDANSPQAVRDREFTGNAEISAANTHARYDFSYQAGVTRHIVVNNERVVNYRTYANDDGGEPTIRFRHADDEGDREIVIHLLPQELIRQALLKRESLRSLGQETIDGRVHDIVSFTRPNGVTVSLLVDTETHLVSRAEELSGNNGRGDVTRWFDYSDWVKVAGHVVPGHFESRKHGRNSFKKFTLDFSDYQTKSEWSGTSFGLPSAVTAEVDNWTIEAPDASVPLANYWGWADGQHTENNEPITNITQIADNLFLLRMPFMDAQIMFYEFDDYVVVFEAPINSATGQLVIDTIAEHTAKPIRYVAAGHHHDHYFGGLRPFIHEGATIIAGEVGAAYIEHLAAWPHILVPDRLQDSGKAPVFKIIDGHLTLAEGDHRVEIYDVGPTNGHTDEYLVFYFPASKVVFNGDLANFRTSGRVPRASQRARSLYNLILDEDLEVDWIYNSWPIRNGYARRGTMAELSNRPGIDEPQE